MSFSKMCAYFSWNQITLPCSNFFCLPSSYFFLLCIPFLFRCLTIFSRCSTIWNGCGQRIRYPWEWCSHEVFNSKFCIWCGANYCLARQRWTNCAFASATLVYFYSKISVVFFRLVYHTGEHLSITLATFFKVNK